jgi:hypothetical protein
MAINTTSKAYLDGLKDGAAWDVNHLNPDHIPREGWDGATIVAMGVGPCADAWGVDSFDAEEFTQACAEYNAGCHAAVCARLSEDA